MPELPEVETTCRGIRPSVQGKQVTHMLVRERRLRWPITQGVESVLTGTTVDTVSRRGKYILLETVRGTLICHLGMSGSLRLLPAQTPPAKHDHVDIVFGNTCLRFNDPRRFGVMLWTTAPVMEHKLLSSLGEEPLTRAFNAKILYSKTRKRTAPIKNVIMDSCVVVGVGNIYAAESLFMARILPTRAASSLSLEDCQRLVTMIKKVLRRSIRLGGTTLRDFHHADGKPGYFQQTLLVYGREGELCRECAGSLRLIRLGQRSTVYCPHCQQ